MDPTNNPLLHLKKSIVEYFHTKGHEISEDSIKSSNEVEDVDLSIHISSLYSSTTAELLHDMKRMQWPLPVDDIFIRGSRINLVLNKYETIAKTMKAIHTCSTMNSNSNQMKILSLTYDSENSLDDLTNYRVSLVVKTVKNLSQFIGYSIVQDTSIRELFFSNKSNHQMPLTCNQKLVLCGPVLNATEKSKETKMHVSEYKSFKQNILLEEMKERDTVNEETASLLADAVLKFDLLRGKVSSPVLLCTGSSNSSATGLAIFILYNYSRLNAILHEYESRVSRRSYPMLPPVEDVDFSVLREKKEWKLLFNFILHFPIVIKNTVKNVDDGVVAPHLLCQFLYSLARTVSSYYRSTKVLLEAQPQLLKLTFARLYLIKAIHQIMCQGLEILNIAVIPAI